MSKELTPLEALKRLAGDHRVFYLEEKISDVNTDYRIIESALKDFEWLKHKLNLRFLNSLSSPEDKMRVMKIMGVEYDETYTK